MNNPNDPVARLHQLLHEYNELTKQYPELLHEISREGLGPPSECSFIIDCQVRAGKPTESFMLGHGNPKIHSPTSSFNSYTQPPKPNGNPKIYSPTSSSYSDTPKGKQTSQPPPKLSNTSIVSGKIEHNHLCPYRRSTRPRPNTVPIVPGTVCDAKYQITEDLLDSTCQKCGKQMCKRKMEILTCKPGNKTETPTTNEKPREKYMGMDKLDKPPDGKLPYCTPCPSQGRINTSKSGCKCKDKPPPINLPRSGNYPNKRPYGPGVIPKTSIQCGAMKKSTKTGGIHSKKSRSGSPGGFSSPGSHSSIKRTKINSPGRHQPKKKNQLENQCSCGDDENTFSGSGYPQQKFPRDKSGRKGVEDFPREKVGRKVVEDEKLKSIIKCGCGTNGGRSTDRRVVFAPCPSWGVYMDCNCKNCNV